MSPFVVRGLRLLPYLQLQRRRNPDSVSLYFDCDRCKKTQTEQTRQMMGCGYLQPVEEPHLLPHVRPWDGQGVGRVPSSDECDEKGKLHLPVCPGYACALPEVHETWWAHQYWEKGELGQFCNGQSTEQLRSAIQLYAAAAAAADRWDHENPVKP